jgi:hypothetical protein
VRDMGAVVVPLLVSFGGSSPAAQWDADLKDTDHADRSIDGRDTSSGSGSMLSFNRGNHGVRPID